MIDFSLESDRLIILPQMPEQAPLVWEYHKLNYPHFKNYIPYEKNSSPEFEEIENMVEAENRMAMAGRAFRFNCFLKDTAHQDNKSESIVADIFIYNIIWGYSKSAHIAYSIATRHSGKGLMAEGISTILDYAFDVLGLHRIEANITPENQKSINLAKKIGFIHEGQSRDLLLLNNKWMDMERFAILSTDSRPQTKNI